jgi:curved DNA-binding protein CbpA
LQPSASPDDIRRAYRRLAQQYHPDKTGNDPGARAQFHAIKEAYETLSQPQLKEAYLQERWLAQSQGLKDHWQPTTPGSLLQKLLTLERKLARQDAYRADYQPWIDQVLSWLSEETVQEIRSFEDRAAEEAAFESCLRIAANIPYPGILKLTEAMQKLRHTSIQQEQLNRQIARSRNASRMEKLTPLFAALIVILLCLLIFLLG